MNTSSIRSQKKIARDNNCCVVLLSPGNINRSDTLQQKRVRNPRSNILMEDQSLQLLYLCIYFFFFAKSLSYNLVGT